MYSTTSPPSDGPSNHPSSGPLLSRLRLRSSPNQAAAAADILSSPQLPSAFASPISSASSTSSDLSAHQIPQSARAAQPSQPLDLGLLSLEGVLVKRQVRAAPFTILAILPEESAPQISTALRNAQSAWELSEHASAFSVRPGAATSSSSSGTYSSASLRPSKVAASLSRLAPITAASIPLEVYSEPANNDTSRLLTSICEWIDVHRPMMVLSLLDRERNFYASLAAQEAGIPFVSLTGSYRNEITALGDDHQVEVCTCIYFNFF